MACAAVLGCVGAGLGADAGRCALPVLHVFGVEHFPPCLLSHVLLLLAIEVRSGHVSRRRVSVRILPCPLVVAQVIASSGPMYGLPTPVGRGNGPSHRPLDRLRDSADLVQLVGPNGEPEFHRRRKQI